jgi:ubiquitin-activating enzyme E1
VLNIAGVEDGDEVVILTFAGDLGPQDVADITQLGAEVVELEDNTGPLEVVNNQQFKVARVEFNSPTDAKVDVNDAMFKQMVVSPTSKCIEHWTKQFDTYAAEHEANAESGGKKMKKREITVMNRLALVKTAAPGAKAGEYAYGEVDVAPFKGFVAGGLVNPQKQASKASYKSLAESLEMTPNPHMPLQESMLRGDGIDIHLAYAAVFRFQELHSRWPATHSAKDADAVVKLAQTISDSRKETDGACWAQKYMYGFPASAMGETEVDRKIDAVRIGRFARLIGTELTGFCAFLGGAIAQEVLKKTGKYLPINGWVHHEDQALVTDECAANISPLGTRYDNQVMVLGKDFQARCANANVFLVGCGALGCEYLKGIALMGVGVGKTGKVTVTDMDVIEISNLSRQFLFRQNHVGSVKSLVGAEVVKGWNPQLKVEGVEQRVGTGTDAAGKEEQFFTTAFWEGIDVCWNALDNVQARQYTDKCCAEHSKPLLESGTLSTKCNGDVFLPFRTKTYNDSMEEEEGNQIAMCTLKGAPYLPLHCIEYAKQAMFSDMFEFSPARDNT